MLIRRVVLLSVLNLAAIATAVDPPVTAQLTAPATQPSNANLIDQLVDVTDRQFSVKTNIFALGRGTRLPQGLRMIQAPDPVPNPAMAELERRGIDALPDLLAHLDDARKTQVIIKAMPSGISYSAEYDWNPHTAKAPPAGTVDVQSYTSPRRVNVNIPAETDGRQYEIRVGDLCFNLIGRIVNRRFLAVRYQPSAIIYVNSPVLCPDLRNAVRNEWAKTTRKDLLDSLIGDVISPASRFQETGALQILDRDYPDSLTGAVRARLTLPRYEESTVRDFAMTQLYVQSDAARRLTLIDQFVKTNGPAYRDGLLQQLWQDRRLRPGQPLTGPAADSAPVPTVAPAEILKQLLPTYDPDRPPKFRAVEQRDNTAFTDQILSLQRPDLTSIVQGR